MQETVEILSLSPQLKVYSMFIKRGEYFFFTFALTCWTWNFQMVLAELIKYSTYQSAHTEIQLLSKSI